MAERISTLVYATAASSWLYRAEGGSAIVFGFAGSPDNPLSTCVLRVRKVVRGSVGGGASARPPPSVAAGACARVRLSRAPAPWLSELASALARSDASRPAARSRADALDADALEVQEDAAMLPRTAHVPAHAQWAVEIKPTAVASRVGGADGVCRFCARAVVHALDESTAARAALHVDAASSDMEERARVGGGAAAVSDNDLTIEAAQLVSLYCPADLYSGDVTRARAALGALSVRPRNNLRAWRGGHVWHDAPPDALLSALAALLCGPHSPLPPLRAVQEAGDAAVGGDEAGALEVLLAAESGNADADARLDDYLRGATAKDASIVVALAWEEDAADSDTTATAGSLMTEEDKLELQSLRSVHVTDVGGRRVVFSFAVVDWEAKDRKRVRKWVAAAERDARVWKMSGPIILERAGKSCALRLLT